MGGCGGLGMDFYRMAGTAIVVCVIGPLFWLGVNVLNNQAGLWIGKAARRWGREESPAKHHLFKGLARLWAVGQKRIL
jgi:hypothetical protein